MQKNTKSLLEELSSMPLRREKEEVVEEKVEEKEEDDTMSYFAKLAQEG